MRLHKGCFIRLKTNYTRRNLSGDPLPGFAAGEILRVGFIYETTKFVVTHPDTRDGMAYLNESDYEILNEMEGKAEWYYLKSRYCALDRLERLARKYLQQLDEKHPDERKHEFVMGMGSWSIWGNGGDSCYSSEVAPELEEFINEWDDYLKLTGHPMRFTATGPVVTDW